MIRREWKVRNQHAVKALWKQHLRDSLKKRLGRGPKPEVIDEHRKTYLAGVAAGAALIVKPILIGADPIALGHWISDLAQELKEEAQT